MSNNNELKDKLRSKVYNALSNAAYEVFETNTPNDLNLTEDEQKKMMEESFEWFMIHFFDK